MHVRLHVAFQLACLRAGMVTQLALVWFFSSMAAPVHHQVALELERLTTKLTGLDLVLCLGRSGAVWGHWWQWWSA